MAVMGRNMQEKHYEITNSYLQIYLQADSINIVECQQDEVVITVACITEVPLHGHASILISGKNIACYVGNFMLLKRETVWDGDLERNS